MAANSTTSGSQAYVCATAVRWVSDEPFPGMVEVQLHDAFGKTWKFIDKAPMFDEHGILTPETPYPVEINLACTVLSIHEDEGIRLVDISTADPWGLEAVDGTFEFPMRPEQVTLRN